MTKDERAEFESIIRAAGRDPSEFEVRDHTFTPRPEITIPVTPLRGQVWLRLVGCENWSLYHVGIWLAKFRHDLEDGRFD